MKSLSHVTKDISLDLNIKFLQIKFDHPVPDTLVLEWARGNREKLLTEYRLQKNFNTEDTNCKSWTICRNLAQNPIEGRLQDHNLVNL